MAASVYEDASSEEETVSQATPDSTTAEPNPAESFVKEGEERKNLCK